MSNTPETAQGDQVAELKREVEAKLRQLRESLGHDEVSIDLGDGIDIELRGLDEPGRVLIGKKNHGHTVVNYTHEGVVIDVWAQSLPEGPVEPVFTTCVYNEDLVGDE